VKETIVHEPKSLGERVEGRLTLDDEPVSLYYESKGYELSSSADAFLVAALIPAMLSGRTLVVESPVSRRLLEMLPDAQNLLNIWWPNLRPIEIEAEAAPPATTKATGEGVFFSLGVDSFYTLMQNQGSLTHLITVKGYDVADLEGPLWAEIVKNSQRVAENFSMELIEVETNVQDLRRKGAGWMMIHGAALASVGHVLADDVGRATISASQMNYFLTPWGTHPLLDSLWSSDRVEIAHFGAVSRIKKTVALADEPLALETMRVCLYSDGSQYNCGSCAKCIGVMLVLLARGRLERAETFPHRVDPNDIKKLDLSTPWLAYYFREILELLRDAKADPQLIGAVQRRLWKSQTKLSGKTMAKMGRGARDAVRHLKRP
jgi:hypothetical protein